MYPYHMNQVPYAPIYYPAFAPHVKPEHVRSAASYEPWQWDGSYGYPYPGQCHGCCNHSYFPGSFTMRPPYPHVPPPSSHGYPPVPGTYPVQYVPPPPHYMMELPRYEYNNVPRDHHCCGCLNHKCNQKEGRNVKIVEEEPDRVETKGDGDSVGPYEFKNYPYPIVWLPPGYTKEQKGDPEQKGCDRSSLRDGKVHEKSKASEEQPNAWNGGWFPFNVNNLRLLDSDHKEKDKSSPRGGKVHEDLKVSEEQKNAWNGEWFPFDVKNLRSLKEGEDHSRSQHNQDGIQNRFPFPLFWMPYKPEATENEEPKEKVIKQEPPKNLESAPVKLDNIEVKQEGKINDEGTKTPDKKTVLKTIPVKQVEHNEEKKASVDTKEKNGEKKSGEDNANIRSSSPRKSPKLPPVCLRIDPLPKKKGRSPSPPGDKGRSHDEYVKTRETSVSSTVKENSKPDASETIDSKDGTRKEVEQNKSKVNSIQVNKGKTIQEGGAKLESAGGLGSNAEKLTTQMPKSSREGHDDEAGNDVKKETIEVESSDPRDKSEPKENLANDAESFRRMKLSEEEAAVVIQSAFRGFEVRKWEPLKKLKQLDEIRKQMGEIKNRIQALESSTDPSSNDKQRIYITEMIMSLLLKLDTIQGVHSSIREIRKSVAKELVSLQETLDLVNSKNMKECVEQPSSTSSEDNISKEMKENLVTDGQDQEDNIGTDRKTESPSPELCQIQPLGVEDADSNSKDVEISGSVMVNGNLGEEIKNLSENGSETGSEQAMEIEVQDDNGEIGDSSVTEAPQDHGGELGQTFESQQVGGETTRTAEMTEPNSTYEAKDAEELAEHPQGAFDGNLDSEISIEHENIESRNDEVVEDICVAPENDEVRDLNRAELLHDKGQKEQVISNVEDVLGGEEQQKPDSEILGEVLPAEFPGEETEVAPGKATEGSEAPIDEVELGDDEARPAIGSEAAASDPNNEVEVGDNEAPPTIVSEVLNELSCVSDEMRDETHYHGVAEVGDNEAPPMIVSEGLGELSRVSDEMRADTHDHDVANPNSLFGSEDTEAVPKACEAPIELSEEDKVEVEKNYLEEGLDDQPVEDGDNEITTSATNLVARSCGSAIAVDEEQAQTESIDKIAKQREEPDISPPSPTASEISRVSDAMTESDRKLIEENEKLREMMEKLLEAGNKQLNTISSLSGRVKDLEKKLSRKKKVKIGRPRMAGSGSSCLKSKNSSSEERAVGLAM